MLPFPFAGNFEDIKNRSSCSARGNLLLPAAAKYSFKSQIGSTRKGLQESVLYCDLIKRRPRSLLTYSHDYRRKNAIDFGPMSSLPRQLWPTSTASRLATGAILS